MPVSAPRWPPQLPLRRQRQNGESGGAGVRTYQQALCDTVRSATPRLRGFISGGASLELDSDPGSARRISADLGASRQAHVLAAIATPMKKSMGTSSHNSCSKSIVPWKAHEPSPMTTTAIASAGVGKRGHA